MNTGTKIGAEILVILLVFSIGFLAANLVRNIDVEIPKGVFHYEPVNSPVDRVSDKNIEVYRDRVIIRLENASLSEYADTKSMLPIFDKGANGIRIIPENENDIRLGDIVTFESSYGLIVHRIIEIGEDEQGTYFITKGDNNLFSDGKIRFEQIKYVTVAVVY